MIQKIKILIPYHPKTKLKKGNEIILNNKNLLLTGNNGTGKSSLLHMILESMNTYQKRLNGRTLTTTSLFKQFYHQSVNIKTQQRQKPLSLKHFKKIFDIGSWIYETRNLRPRFLYEAFNNPDLLPQTKIEEKVFKTYLMETMDSFDGLPPQTEEKIDIYIDCIKRYSKEMGLETSSALGIMHALETGYFYQSQNLLSQFFYTQIFGENIDKLNINAIYQIPGNGEKFLTKNLSDGKVTDILENNHETKNGKILKHENNFWIEKRFSTGEKRKAHLEKILSVKSDKLYTVILLDEPTQSLDEKNATKYTNKIIKLSKRKNTQIILATQDRMLKNDLRKASGWIEYELK